MITITKIKQTCHVCPSQWDGWDKQGNYYYFRYRWGHLRIDRAPSKDEWAKLSSAQEIVFEKIVGDDFDGYMTFEELRGHVSEIINIVTDGKI